MGLKDKLNAAMERVNAGRQAKLAAKSEVAASQGKYKKAARLEMRSKKVALRDEKRDAIQTAKTTQKIGKALGNMRGLGEMAQEKSQPMAEKRRQFETTRIEKPMIPKIVTPPPTDANFQNKFQSKSFRDENIEKILKARKQ